MTGLACSRAEDAIRRAEALTPTQRRAIFTQFDPACIRAQADALDARALAGEEMPLYGLTVSIKDLFDEEGQVTSAGSRLLAGAAPAKAAAVAAASPAWNVKASLPGQAGCTSGAPGAAASVTVKTAGSGS